MVNHETVLPKSLIYYPHIFGTIFQIILRYTASKATLYLSQLMNLFVT